ncbi:MAG TPA: sigma-70 family RNA polymerase sigma factor [Thermoanaerobaculia bacterium]|nr:sigma-70 family RNA polymerase sigma factor [Thermoanaerobaculia bacterium]
MSPPRPEDEEILAAVRALQTGAGPDAFETIFARFYRPLFLFYANRPALSEEAADLAQTTLIRVYQNIHQYRFEASFQAFQAWLWHIGENVWKNAVRDRQAVKRGPSTEALESGEDETPDPAPRAAVFAGVPATPEDLVLRRERIRILREAIDRLPQGMRQCLELRLFADLKYQEISDVMGIGLSSVKSQLFEAKRRLKLVLDEHFQGVDF